MALSEAEIQETGAWLAEGLSGVLSAVCASREGGVPANLLVAGLLYQVHRLVARGFVTHEAVATIYRSLGEWAEMHSPLEALSTTGPAN